MPRTLSVFNSVSIDGFFTDDASDMSWAHSPGSRVEQVHVHQRERRGRARVRPQDLRDDGPVLAQKEAAQAMPEVARGMNRMRKTVFSHTLKSVDWENSRVAQADLATEIRRMKSEPGPNLLILGSGEIVAQLTQAGLIDAYQLVVVPIVLGSGRTLFEGVTGKPRLELTKTQAFSNGNVVCWYERVAQLTMACIRLCDRQTVR